MEQHDFGYGVSISDTQNSDDFCIKVISFKGSFETFRNEGM
jgi:hypothetical protein